jgi:hypothetical protein
MGLAARSLSYWLRPFTPAQSTRRLETRDARLSKGMRQLNGAFTHYSVHQPHTCAWVGHLFQGCFKAILVERLRKTIAEHYGVSRMTVSRAVKRHEDESAAHNVTCEI